MGTALLRVVLTAAEGPAPAARLAALHDVSPSYLAKQLQALSRAGLIQSVQGKAGGYVLTRSSALITVLDVVEAVDGPGPAFVCTEIRQRGPMATPGSLRRTLRHQPRHGPGRDRLAGNPPVDHRRRPRHRRHSPTTAPGPWAGSVPG